MSTEIQKAMSDLTESMEHAIDAVYTKHGGWDGVVDLLYAARDLISSAETRA